MKPRIRKRCAPQRQQSDSNQTVPVPRRQSSRLQSRQRSVSILHSLETCYDPQSLFEERLAHPETSQHVTVISNTRLPTSDPIAASTLVPSREQLKGYLCPPINSYQSRKRKQDKSVKTSIGTPTKRACLTKKNLKSFERMAGPARQDPRPKSPQSWKPSRSEPKSSRSESKSLLSNRSKSSSKTVSTTNSRFPFLAGKNGILWDPNAKPPTNLEFLQDRLRRARGTPSPTKSEYEVATHNLVVAENEGTVAGEGFNLLKNHRVPGYRRAINLPFKDFPKDVGFNNRLSPAQPDLIEGLEMQEFDPFPASEQLTAGVPYLTGNAITLPHFAGEWKGPGKDMNLARVQVAYNGASMVYARNEACLFLGSPDPISSAHVVTFTCDGTSLNTFANYSSATHGQIKYHQYPITTSCIRSSYTEFKNGRRQLRNLQDYAKETSETLRDKLNENWSASQPPTSTSLPAGAIEARDDSYDDDTQEDGEDDPNVQLLREYYASVKDQDGFNPPYAPQTLTSYSGHNPIDGLEVLTPTNRYNISHSPQALSTDDGYNPDASLAQNASR